MKQKAILSFILFMQVFSLRVFSQIGSVYNNADYSNACVLSWDSHFNDGCAVVRYHGAYAYINDQGKEILPSNRNMSNDRDFSEGLKCMSKSEVTDYRSSYGFVDKQGKYVIEDIFMYPSIFSEGLAKVYKPRQCGFIDKTGKMVIEIHDQYSDIKPFKDGMAAVKKDGKWGFINKQGVLSVPIIYDNVCDFSEGLAAVDQNGKCGFVDKNGKMVIPAKYAPGSTITGYTFKNGYAEVFVEGYEMGLGILAFYARKDFDGYANYTDPSTLAYKSFIAHKRIIDKNGNEIKGAKSISGLDGVYTYVNDINVSPHESMSFGLKSLSGNVVLPPTYGYIGDFNNGLALVFNANNKAGFIDKQGNIKIQCKYDDGNIFSEGIAAVKKGRKWGYVNTQGSEITPFIFDEARPCKGGFACVKIGDGYGFISKNGAPLKIDLSGETFYVAGNDEERFWKPNDSSTTKYLEKAINFYKKGADKGESFSCYKLGYYSFFGAGSIEKNYAEAVKWFTKCQSGNKRTNGNDLLFLGYCYSEGGFGISKDDNMAFQYFKKGAELNNDECNRNLAICYLNGLGCTKNIQEACKYADKIFDGKDIENAPLYADCYNRLAYEYVHKNNFTQAFAIEDKLLSSLSNLYNKTKESAEGLKEDDKAYYDTKEEMDLLKHIMGYIYDSKGEFYLMRRNTDEALKMWNKVMEYDKKNLDFYKDNSELYKQLKAKGLI